MKGIRNHERDLRRMKFMKQKREKVWHNDYGKKNESQAKYSPEIG